MAHCKIKLWLPELEQAVFTVSGNQVLVGVMSNANDIFFMNLEDKQKDASGNSFSSRFKTNTLFKQK